MVYFLSLGSNLGNKSINLARAIRLLRKNGVEALRVSSIFRTEPVDYTDQPWFENQVIEARTALDPRALLQLARSIESEMKRVPLVAKGPRTIDIDILMAGDLVIETPELVIPHPRLARRNFVLVPFCEIAPEVRHPVLHKTIRELATESADPSRVMAKKPGRH